MWVVSCVVLGCNNSITHVSRTAQRWRKCCASVPTSRVLVFEIPTMKSQLQDRECPHRGHCRGFSLRVSCQTWWNLSTCCCTHPMTRANLTLKQQHKKSADTFHSTLSLPFNYTHPSDTVGWRWLHILALVFAGCAPSYASLFLYVDYLLTFDIVQGCQPCDIVRRWRRCRRSVACPHRRLVVTHWCELKVIKDIKDIHNVFKCVCIFKRWSLVQWVFVYAVLISDVYFISWKHRCRYAST